MFDFLRLVFRDRRLEASEAALAIAQAKLNDYECRLKTLEARIQQPTNKEVEPDFIVLLWTFIVLVAGVTVNTAAGQLTPILVRLLDNRSEPLFHVADYLFPLLGWGLIFVSGLVFTVYGGVFVYKLLLEYTKRKEDPGYQRFVKRLFYFFLVYIVGTIFTVIGSVVINLVFDILSINASIGPTTGF